MIRAVQKYRRMPAFEKSLILEAAAVLPTMSLGLRTLGLRRCQQLVEFVRARSRARSPVEPVEVTTLVRSIRRASNGMQIGTCLTRALTGQFMAVRRGIQADLRIGVRRTRDALTAHAWLEHGRKPVGEQAGVEAFSVFDDLDRADDAVPRTVNICACPSDSRAGWQERAMKVKNGLVRSLLATTAFSVSGMKRFLPVALLLLVSPHAGATYYLFTNSTSATIPETAGCTTQLTRTFTVSGITTNTINELAVGINITHTDRGQVRVNLQSPGGTTVTIKATSADTDDNYDLLLDDDSVSAIDNNATDNTAVPYYERNADPSNALSAFDGQNPNGTWTMTICDNATAGAAGTFNRATLFIRDSVPTCPDGSPQTIRGASSDSEIYSISLSDGTTTQVTPQTPVTGAINALAANPEDAITYYGQGTTEYYFDGTTHAQLINLNTNFVNPDGTDDGLPLPAGVGLLDSGGGTFMSDLLFIGPECNQTAVDNGSCPGADSSGDLYDIYVIDVGLDGKTPRKVSRLNLTTAVPALATSGYGDIQAGYIAGEPLNRIRIAGSIAGGNSQWKIDVDVTDANNDGYVEVAIVPGSFVLYAAQITPSGAGVQLAMDSTGELYAGYHNDDTIRHLDRTTGQRGDLISVNFPGTMQDLAGPFNCPQTTDVRLRRFRATGSGSGTVTFDWETGKETGNLGFELLAQRNGQWEPISGFIESKVINSNKPTRYNYQGNAGGASEFILVDIDTRGKRTRHGPYKLGEQYGRNESNHREVDWKQVRREHEANKRERRLANRSKLSGKVQRLASESSTLTATATAATTASQVMNLEVTADGVYRVTHEQLLAAGMDLSGVARNNIAVLNLGKAVPVNVEGPGKNFGPGSYVEFLGTAVNSLYTDKNVYTLTVDRNKAQKTLVDNRSIPSGVPVPYYVESLTVETQQQYDPASPTDDPWFDAYLLAVDSPASTSKQIFVDNYAPEYAGACSSGAATGCISVAVNTWGVTDFPENPDHHVVVDLNGAAVGEATFDGAQQGLVEGGVSSGVLVEGTNTVNVTLPQDTGVFADMINVDSYRLTYPRRFVARNGRLAFTAAGNVFKVSGLPENSIVVYRTAGGKITQVKSLQVAPDGGAFSVTFPGTKQAATYYVAAVGATAVAGLNPVPGDTDIKSGTAKLLIISHADFIDALTPLVTARSAQGYSVQVVDVADVYAQFGFHIPGADAIRSYIRHAAKRMGTKYVLLVGGDNYDYKNYLGPDSVSFIPSPYAPAGNRVRFAPVDPLYTDLDDDRVPDLPIGRFIALTADEAVAMVNQTLAYQNNTAGGGYGRTALFTADAFDQAAGRSFSKDSNALIGKLPTGWNVDRAYAEELGGGPARDKLIKGINCGVPVSDPGVQSCGGTASGGVALTTYVGHSDPGTWSIPYLSGFSLFDLNDARNLQNAGKPTVVVQMGCWNTYYVAPDSDTLGHQLMLNGDTGAAAVLGAATLTDAGAEAGFANALYEFVGDPGVTIGDAITAAKKRYACGHAGATDVILGWTLLGDPTLMVDPEGTPSMPESYQCQLAVPSQSASSAQKQKLLP